MVAVASSSPTGDNFFSQFIFLEFICLTDLLSDLLIVKNPNISAYCKYQMDGTVFGSDGERRMAVVYTQG